MRYLVCSDLHLNLNRRLEDTVEALGQIARLVTEQLADKVFILGDVYTSRRPHPREKIEFETWVKQVADTIAARTGNTQDAVVIIKGNHDEYPDGTHTLHEFTILRYPGIQVFDNPHLHDGFFLGHMLLREAELGPAAYHQPDALSLDDVIARYPGCNAYLFGDVHKHQVLRREPLALYIGSIVPTDFGERHDPKGVVLIEHGQGEELSWQFVPLRTRPLIQYDVDLDEPKPHLRSADVKGAVVKLIYYGTHEQIAGQALKETTVRAGLQPHCHELVIQYHLKRAVTARERRVNETSTPVEALRLYLDRIEVFGDSDRQRILVMGEEIIQQCRG